MTKQRSLFSIIVFSERCELKKVTVYSEDIKVIKRDKTYDTVKEIWEKNPDALSEEKINEEWDKVEEEWISRHVQIDWLKMSDYLALYYPEGI